MERASRIVGGVVLAVVAASLLALTLVGPTPHGSILSTAIMLAGLAVTVMETRMPRKETEGPVYSPRRWIAPPPYQRPLGIVFLVLLSLLCATWCFIVF